MFYRHHIRVDKATLPNSAFDAICEIAPEGEKPYGFHLQVDSEELDGGQPRSGLDAADRPPVATLVDPLAR